MGEPTARRAGVRVRVLSTVLALCALGMFLAGASALLVQWRSALDRVDAGIRTDVLQFRSLAAAGRDSQGRPAADVAALLNYAVEQVPLADEMFLGVVDGQPVYVSGSRQTVDLAHEPAVLTRVARLTASSGVTITSADTSAGTVRYAAVPVQLAGTTQTGVFVVAFALAPSQDAVLSVARVYAVVALLTLAVVGGVGWLVAGRLLRPLRLLREAAAAVTSRDLSLRIPVTGDDDVSELTRTVNGMLDRLQESFETQQRFLDDAGHELRTPMTIITGHLEVLDVADPSDVAAVRALVLDELDRMARLVGDLILLAKTRRPDFVRPAVVDLDGLLDDVLEKARALGPRQWAVEARTGRSVRADGQRLTQALLQLADNAVRHTHPGDAVTLGSAVVGGVVRLWVRDTGVGIAAEDHARIFERFGRAGRIQSRGDEGSGLGLAIVSAIATAHGGNVTVESAPGAGATFTVVLPGAALVPAPGAPSLTGAMP